MRLKPPTFLALLFFVLLAILIFGTVSDYGYSWDEDVRARQGEKKLEYYQAFLAGDFEQASERVNEGDRYPGFYDLNLALLRRASPFDPILTGHIFSAIFGFLAVLGVWKLATLLAGPWAGNTAALLLVLFPVWYGHQFINPKDIPFACGYIWSIFWIVRSSGEFPSVKWSSVFGLGAVIGITMATRVGGLVLYCYVGLFLLIGLIALFQQHQAELRDFFRRTLLPVAVRGAVAAGISFAILFAYWPAAHQNLFAHTAESLGAVTQFDWSMPVLYRGNYYEAGDLPLTFVHHLFLLVTPLPLLLLLLAGTMIGVRRGCVLWKRKMEGEEPDRRTVQVALVAFAVVFPLAYVIARDSTLYNGIRHLLFVVPPAAVLGALAFLHINTSLRERWRAPVWALPAVTAALYLPVLVTMVQLHPYQYIYYNALAGGVRGAAGEYESEYWATAYKEAAEILLDHLATLPDTETTGQEFVVNMEHPTWLLAPYLNGEHPYRLKVVRSDGEQADFYVAGISWEAHQYYYGDVVGTVERKGVPLAYVKDRRNLLPEERVMYYGLE